MRWTDNDSARFLSQVIKLLGQGNKEDAIDDLVRLIGDTFLSFKLPVEDTTIVLKLIDLFEMMKKRNLEKKLKAMGIITPAQFFMGIITKWVGNTVNANC